VAVLSNDKSIFGNIVPSIYINKVTLENGRSVFRADKKDRILAHTNRKAPTSISEGIQTGIEEYYEEFSYPIPTDKSLKITVDYVIKDGIDGSIGELLSTWSNDGDLQNYTNTYFVLLEDTLASKILSVGSNIDTENNKSILKFNLMFAIIPLIQQGLLTEEEKQKLIGMGLKEESFQTPYSGLQYKSGANAESVSSQVLSFVEKNTITSEKMTLKGVLQESALSAELEVDDSGKKIKNYRFSKTYQYSTDAPNNLSVVAACSLNLQNMEDTFGLDLSFLKLNSPTVGKRAVQDIFRNGKIASTNFIYMLKSTSEIWTGQVYKVNNLFYTEPDAATAQELVKKAVSNNKIQDFRISEEIQKIKFNLSFLQSNEFSLASAHKVTRDKTDAYKSPPYFTKNYVSRDFDGNARFMFGVDYYSLVRDLTLYGGILPKTTNVFSLMSHRLFAQVLNMSIKRKRVDVVPRSNRLGTYNAKEIPFKTGYLGEPHIDAEEIISTISMGSEKILQNGMAGDFSSNPTTNTNSIQEVSITAPDMGSEVGTLGFRYFAADDFQIKNFTDGKYQYGIEMEILDRSSIYIINSIVKLIEAYKALSIYYTLATTPNIYYNTRTGKFNDTLNQKYAGQEFKPWEYASNRLANVINEYKLDSTAFDSESTKERLILMTRPTTGTPRGVETLLNLLLNAAAKLAQVVGTSLNSSAVSQIAAGSTKVAVSADNVLSSRPDKRIIKIQYWIDDIFDTEVPKKYGYDFLTPTGKSFTSSGRGLLTIPGQAFNERLRQEMLKYFKAENPSSFDMIDTDTGESVVPGTIYDSLFSYLSPSAINIGVSSGGDTEDVTGKTPPQYSLLQDSTPFQGSPVAQPFYDKKGYSYVATKIMNYNNTSILPPYDTSVNQNTKTLLSQAADKMKYHTQQILTNKNCVAVMDNVLANSQDTTFDNSGLFMSLYLGKEIDDTDPLENNNIKLSEVQDNPLNISYKGGAEVSTFLSFVYGYSNQCGGLASTKKPSQETNSKETNFDFRYFNVTLQSSNIRPVPSIIGKIKKDLLQQDGTMNVTKMRQRLRELPNPIKALILQSNPDARVRSKWGNLDGNPATDPYYKAVFGFNYRNIKRVEYLAGFERATPPPSTPIELFVAMVIDTPPDVPQINSPIWKTLDAETYTSSIGKKLFCRLKTYSKPEHGIVPMECLEMPVFDEFFILEPSSYDGSFVQSPPVPTPPPVTTEDDGMTTDYANSLPPITEPTEEEKVQAEKNSIIADGNSALNPDNPVAGPFGGMNLQGILGGPAGGPPADDYQEEAINMEKI